MKNKKLLLIILSVMAIFSLLYGIFSPSRAKRFLNEEGKKIMTEEGAIYLERQARRSSYSSWGRNPFSASKSLIKRPQGVILNGILWDSKNPMAIVNEGIVKEGDIISGNKVIEIKQDRVILNDGSKDIELFLSQQ